MATAAQPTLEGLYSDPGTSTFDLLDRITSDEPTTTAAADPIVPDTPQTNTEAPTTDAPAGTGETTTLSATPAVEGFETAPKEFQSILSHPNLGKEAKEYLKTTWKELGDYRESLGTVAEAKEIRGLFPNGVAEARTIAETAIQADRNNMLYESADPEQQAEMLTPLFRDYPEASLAATQVSLGLTQQMFPNEYAQIRAGMARDHFENVAPDLVPFMDHMAQLAANGQVENLGKAAMELGTWWARNTQKLGLAKGKEQPADDPRISTFQKEIQSRDEEKRGYTISTLESQHMDTVKPIFMSAIEKAASARGIKPNSARLEKFAYQVADQFNAAIKNDKSYQMFLDKTVFGNNRKSVSAWKTDRNTLDAVMKNLSGRAQKSASALADKIIGDFIEDMKSVGTPQGEPPIAGAGVRTGATRGAAANGNKKWTDDEFRNPNVSTEDLLGRITN